MASPSAAGAALGLFHVVACAVVYTGVAIAAPTACCGHGPAAP